jgi:hypothetical protein
LDSITKNVVYSDSTSFRSDTIFGDVRIYILHFD